VVLVPSFLPFLQPFSSCMTRPTFASFCTLVGGWVFATRHNVTGSLRAGHHAGRRATAKHFCAYHRVFAAARWSLDRVGLALLGLILLSALAAGATAFLVIDDTLCPKRGYRMFGVDSHYDAANTGRRRSNANQGLKRRGHCWVILGVLIVLPCTGDYCCLPVLFRLYMNRKGARRNKEPYRSRPQLARDLLSMVCGHWPGRRFHALVDSAYAGQDTLRQLPANCELTARWQMNVRLCEPAPQHRTGGRRGPLPKRGPLLGSPKQVLEGRQGRCEHLEVKLYGRDQKLRVWSRQACLYTVPERLLRVVAAEPLTASGKPRPKHRAFYFSTSLDADVDAGQVLRWYALRWKIEVSVRDAKQQMGFGQPQGWSEQAVRRTAPTLMLLYSAVVLWFRQEGHRRYRRPVWPWYKDKTAVSFADMLCTLRLCVLRQHLKQNLSTPPSRQGSRNPLRIIIRLARLAA
jgi:hypothetical protein